MAEQFMTAEEADRYIDGRIARAMAPKRGFLQRVWSAIWGIIWLVIGALVITVFAFAARVQYGLPIPLSAGMVATAAVTFSTAAAPLPIGVQQNRPPASLPMGSGGGAPPWPTLTPEPTITQEVPASTATPAPTVFWAPEELTAFAVTATAFIEVIPTAPPAFVQYTEDACSDPEQVAESATLRLFCGK